MKKKYQTFYAFTFVELLLGFLIFSVVVLVLYSTFFSGLKIQKRANNDGAMAHQVKMTLDMMTGELQEAIHFDFSNAAPALTSFEGTKDRVSFLTTGKDGAIKRVSYYVTDKDKVRILKTLVGNRYQKNVSAAYINQKKVQCIVLMRSEELFIDFVSGKKSSSAREETLLDNIQKNSFKFFYADLAPDQSSLIWNNVWDETYIPAGIRLEMTLVPLQEKEKPMEIKKDFYIPSGSWGAPS